jgi:hypothetical protein
VRLDAAGELERLVLCRGRSLQIGAWNLELNRSPECLEVVIEGDYASVLSGDVEMIGSLTHAGRDVSLY